MTTNTDGKSTIEKEESPREYTKEELDAARKKLINKLRFMRVSC